MATDAGTITGHIDLPRMRRDRFGRLQAEMAARDIPALLVFGSGAVQYAAGPALNAVDGGRALHLRTGVLVLAGDDQPHLFTPSPDAAPPELATDHLHPAFYTESDQGVVDLAGTLLELSGGSLDRLAVDDLSGPMYRLAPQLLGGTELVDASRVLGPARVIKTDDELELIRRAQHINEVAMHEVQAALVPGIRQTELTGMFLRRAFELGATGNGIDPIWQVMAPTRSAGPYTTHGDVAFPLTTTDRALEDGDVIWVDTGIHYHGYASDFGRTWIVGHHPRATPRQRDQYRRWQEVVTATLAEVRPGSTGADLTAAARAAVGGDTPWLPHFYLIHGLGTESAEAPMFGTDLGPEHDAALVLAPGMVLVLEPVIWDDGEAGYRSEDIVAVTDDGWTPLSDYPYAPFDR
jgi:Xaa-Pro aminopeptidase